MIRPREQAKYDAIVAGYLCVDLTPGFAPSRQPVPLGQLLQPGRLVQVEGLSMAPGGAVANTGLAMRRFGQRVALAGMVGHDPLGDLLLRAMPGDAGSIRRSDRAGTGYGIVIAPPGSDRLFLEDPGCHAYFSAESIDPALIAQSRLVHLGYPPLLDSLYAEDGRPLQRLMARIQELGVTTSLDMTLPDPGSPAGQADWRGILDRTLPHVDIFVPSIEELLFMLDPQAYATLNARAGSGGLIDAIDRAAFDRLADRVLRLGVKVLLIKAGHRGAYLRTAGSPAQWIDPFPVDPDRMINACGAGDCAVAAFLAALLNGNPVEQAARYAMLAGRDNLYGIDALSGLRDWNAMTRHLETGSA